jgi:Arc/MetJ-type ribon-helix-helix transcriptional regulator
MNVSLSPQLRRFVKKRANEGPHKSESGVVCEALRGMIESDRIRLRIASGLSPWSSRTPDRASGASDSGSDIEALVFTVLMEAANDADKDLELIMAEVKAMTNAKQALRSILSKVGRDVAANAGQEDGRPRLNLKDGMGSTGAYKHFQMPFPDPQADCGVGYYAVDVVPGKGPLTGLAQLKCIQSILQGDLDGMSGLSEMTSLRLQMAMDRRSKLMIMLSNVMKKMSDTQESIVQNMK